MTIGHEERTRRLRSRSAAEVMLDSISIRLDFVATPLATFDY